MTVERLITLLNSVKNKKARIVLDSENTEGYGYRDVESVGFFNIILNYNTNPYRGPHESTLIFDEDELIDLKTGFDIVEAILISTKTPKRTLEELPDGLPNSSH